MSLSDCEKCWDTPCQCGWEYRGYSREGRAKQAAVVLGIPQEGPLFDKLLALTPEEHPMKGKT